MIGSIYSACGPDYTSPVRVVSLTSDLSRVYNTISCCQSSCVSCCCWRCCCVVGGGRIIRKKWCTKISIKRYILITNHLHFLCVSPYLWNQLSASYQQPHYDSTHQANITSLLSLSLPLSRGGRRQLAWCVAALFTHILPLPSPLPSFPLPLSRGASE